MYLTSLCPHYARPDHCRSGVGSWRFSYTETKRQWAEEYGNEPFVLPDTAFVSMDSPHPAETSMGSYLGYYGESTSQGSWRAGAHALYVAWLQRQAEGPRPGPVPAPAAPQPAAQPRPPPPPAAAKKKKSGGLFACFRASVVEETQGAAAQQQMAAQRPAQQQQNQQQALSRKAADVQAQLTNVCSGFVRFQGLPHCSSHPYWKAFVLRCVVRIVCCHTCKAKRLCIRGATGLSS
jgi:hypothetical protein